MKSEHISVTAIVIAILSGGGGLTLNSFSNAAVIRKLDEVSTSITRIEEDRKAIAEDRRRTDAQLAVQAKVISDDHDEIAALRLKIAVLETKVK
jgi:hypothetical protein